MGACVSRGGAAVDKTPLIIDVEQKVADAAWDMFYCSKSRWQRLCMRRKDFTIEVPMNYFHFQVIDQQFTDVEKDEINDDKKKDNGKPIRSDLKGRQFAHQRQTAPEHLGLETEFKNSTGEKQTYNFKCEKTRKATMTVTYQKGFSIGGKANFSLGLPKILSDGTVTSEVDMRVNVSKTTGETFEQTLTTCATSDITVAPHSHYIATVVMEERHFLANFEVTVKMTMPAKEARAMIKTSRGETVFFYKLRDLTELFDEDHQLPDEGGDPRWDAVQFVIEGRVDGMQLSSHRIHLVDQALVSSGGQGEEKEGKPSPTGQGEGKPSPT